MSESYECQVLLHQSFSQSSFPVILTPCYLSLLPPDLGRMFNLVARIPDGLGQLRTLLENHITNQGLNALEKCGDQAFNVSKLSKCSFKQC